MSKLQVTTEKLGKARNSNLQKRWEKELKSFRASSISLFTQLGVTLIAVLRFAFAIGVYFSEFKIGDGLGEQSVLKK